jgi:hypothetical protein
MKRADDTLRELGQLYDFQKELARFRLRPKAESSKAAQESQGNPLESVALHRSQRVKTASKGSRSGPPGRASTLAPSR